VGEAVLTSTIVAQNFSAQAKLNREQVRSKNKEALIEVINNEMIITTDGQSYVVDDLAKIKDIELSYNGKQEIEVRVHYKDGLMNFKVPSFMGEGIKSFLDKHEIAYKVE